MRDVPCDLAGLSPPARQHHGFTISGAEVIFRACAPSVHEQSGISRMLRE
jgi:hypothetical protein